MLRRRQQHPEEDRVLVIDQASTGIHSHDTVVCIEEGPPVVKLAQLARQSLRCSHDSQEAGTAGIYGESFGVKLEPQVHPLRLSQDVADSVHDFSLDRFDAVSQQLAENVKTLGLADETLLLMAETGRLCGSPCP